MPLHESGPPPCADLESTILSRLAKQLPG
jgi:hypothetical protein